MKSIQRVYAYNAVSVEWFSGTSKLYHLNSVSSQKSIPKIFNGKKTFKKCNPLDFKFYLNKFNNKNFTHRCNVNFVSTFTALNNIKKQRKFNITPYGEIFFR